jgi:hypothetical protein
MKFAGDILDKRTKDDVSFRQLQALLSVDKQVLHKAESGGMPKLETFFVICRWLDKPMENYFVKPKTKSNATQHRSNKSGKKD